MRLVLIVACIVASVAASGQTYAGSPRWQKLRSIHKDSLYRKIHAELQFIGLNAGDTVADIGSYDGYYPAVYSVFSDSIVFSLQDITEEGFYQFDSLLAVCSSLKGKAITNRFSIFTGTGTSTGLPSHSFNKVILRDVLHHFEQKEQMLTDIKRVMKPGAKLMLYETLREGILEDTYACKEAMSRNELVELMKQNGFELARERKTRYHSWLEFRFAGQ